MARLPLVDPNDPDADPSAREVLNAVIGRGGVAPNVFRAIANHPRALAAMAQFASTVYYRNSLTPAQRELTYLTASLTNDCHYWIPTHVLLGRAAGLTEEKLAHLGDDPLPAGLYEPDEAALVLYAQRSTRMDVIDDATYGALADHFSAEQCIEICFTVGLSNMINRFHATFLTDLDPATQEALGTSCPLAFPEPPAH